MANRSAHATIKGYFYQFDHTIIQLLCAPSPGSIVVTEGIEDVDLKDGNDEVLIQCKYYEGTEYNHSVIKDSVIQMVRHFHQTGCNRSAGQKYRIYGHYSSGQEKLPENIDLDFLRDNFLTKSGKTIGVKRVHDELALDDVSLADFLSRLEIDVCGRSYIEQQQEIERLLLSNIDGCTTDDVNLFFYPLAINIVQGLAIKKDENDRTISKSNFITAISKKDAQTRAKITVTSMLMDRENLPKKSVSMQLNFNAL